jgi:biopolymer transport protein ExbD
MASKLHVDHEAPLAEINVTPLVDVMLVLLVIFMILSPLFAQALQVDLPSVNAPSLSEPKVMDVVVKADGQIESSGQPVELEQLGTEVQKALQQDPKTVLRLGADASVDYGRVAAVIAVLQQAGGERLAFATRQAQTAPIAIQ